MKILPVKNGHQRSLPDEEVDERLRMSKRRAVQSLLPLTIRSVSMGENWMEFTCE